MKTLQAKKIERPQFISLNCVLWTFFKGPSEKGLIHVLTADTGTFGSLKEHRCYQFLKNLWEFFLEPLSACANEPQMLLVLKKSQGTFLEILAVSVYTVVLAG